MVKRSLARSFAPACLQLVLLLLRPRVASFPTRHGLLKRAQQNVQVVKPLWAVGDGVDDEIAPELPPGTVRYAARVSYDGTRYNGWQSQPKQRTVQDTLEKHLHTVASYTIRQQVSVRTVAAGRTDAGVHSRGQAIHFDLPGAIPDLRLFEYGLNMILPEDIRIWNVSMAPSVVPNATGRPWHAMVSSTGKLYTYRGTTQKIVCPLERLYRAQVPFITDLSVVRGLAPRFVGTHDFRNFANRLKHKYKGMSAERFSTVRTIESLDYVDEGDGRFRMEFRLTGALQRMVRNIVGSLLLVGKGGMREETLMEALDGKAFPNGTTPIRSAPAHGLTLEHVYYKEF